MTEEKTEEKEEKPKEQNFLERVREERKALETARDEVKALTSELKELKAIDIIGGKTESKQPLEKKEVDPKTYAENLLQGKILE
jgi:hypothetical protein